MRGTLSFGSTSQAPGDVLPQIWSHSSSSHIHRCTPQLNKEWLSLTERGTEEIGLLGIPKFPKNSQWKLATDPAWPGKQSLWPDQYWSGLENATQGYHFQLHHTTPLPYWNTFLQVCNPWMAAFEVFMNMIISFHTAQVTRQSQKVFWDLVCLLCRALIQLHSEEDQHLMMLMFCF